MMVCHLLYNIHIDFYWKQYVFANEVIALDVSETADYSAHPSLQKWFTYCGEGFLFVYSTTSCGSFDELSAFRQRVLHVKECDSILMILVTTKCDLKNRRQVSTAEGQEMAEQWNCKFFETSAKYCINVDKAFYTLVREIRKYSLIAAFINRNYRNNRGKTKSNSKSCKCLIL